MQNRTRWMTRLLLLVIVLIQIGCAGMTETRHVAESRIDDHTIRSQIMAELARDPDTKASQIQVETFQGIVQLSGFVDDQEAIIRAGELARGVEGVRWVQNNLSLH